MTYIDKAAVVAEIESLLDKGKYHEVYDYAYRDGNNGEVDLQSEIDRVWDNTSDNFSEDGWKEFEEIAKHFFELGLKAQKEE